MCLAVELDKHVRIIAVVEYPCQNMLTGKTRDAFSDVEITGFYTLQCILNRIDTWLTVTMAMTVKGLLCFPFITVSVIVTPDFGDASPYSRVRLLV